MTDPDTALMAELQLERAALKRALNQASEDTDRLRGLWPRAELQRLHLELAQKSAEQAWLAEHYAALQASTLANLPRPVFTLARRLRPALRLLRRLAGLVRRSPQRLALSRQRRADRGIIAASPLFDTAWYRAAAGDDAGGDLIGHYLWLGHAAGHDPHPLFDGVWYAARHPELGLENPFAHYLSRGMAADEDPHPLFDTAFYLAQAPEAAGRALLHYGSGQGAPAPAPLFDPVDYPEGLAHWIHDGAARGRDPHALFASDWYRRTYLRDRPAVNPLAHWARDGASAGLPPNPFGLDPAAPARLAEPGPHPSASVIIRPGADAMAVTRSLLSVAQGSHQAAFEAILIGDKERSLGWLPGLRTAPSLPAAVAAAKGRFLVFLGPGAVGHRGWLDPLLDAAQDDVTAGVVGAKLLSADGSLGSMGLAFGEGGQLDHNGAGEDPTSPSYAFARPVDAVDPAAMLVRREAWDMIGGLDDGYASDIFAAADLAFALRARGWRVIVQPASVATITHPADPGGDEPRFVARWAADLSAQASSRTVLVLTDAIPGPGTPAARALDGVRGQGARALLHTLDDALLDGAAAWERRGVEVLRSPTLFDDWLARHGASLDEVWSFRDPAGVPADALLRHTGAALLHWPNGPAPAWSDGKPPA